MLLRTASLSIVSFMNKKTYTITLTVEANDELMPHDQMKRLERHLEGFFDVDSLKPEIVAVTDVKVDEVGDGCVDKDGYLEKLAQLFNMALKHHSEILLMDPKYSTYTQRASLLNTGTIYFKEFFAIFDAYLSFKNKEQ